MRDKIKSCGLTWGLLRLLILLLARFGSDNVDLTTDFLRMSSVRIVCLALKIFV